MSNERVESAELASLASLIEPTAHRLAERGHRLFFVGGIVRDLLLSVAGSVVRDGPPDFSDVDLTTDARPEVIKAALGPSAEAMWTQGERFGTIGAMIDDHAFEITTHRAEVYDEASRKPVVTFGDDLEIDLSRRDFTINAMAIDVTTLQLLDPFEGLTDLDSRRLRTPLDPAISFTDDPLRMLRAARFIPRFGLSAAPELVESARVLADRLSIVSGERIHDELEKLLELPDPRAGLAFLSETGLLDEMGLGPAVGRLDAVATLSSRRARRAALVLDLPDGGVGSFLADLRYSNADRRSTTRVLAGAHRLADALDVGSVGAHPASSLEPLLRTLAVDSGADALDDITELAVLLGATHDDIATVRATLHDLRAREDLDDRRPPLEGNEVMDILGVGSGPIVGDAFRHLEGLRVTRGPLSPDEARAELRSWSGRGQGEPS